MIGLLWAVLLSLLAFVLTIFVPYRIKRGGTGLQRGFLAYLVGLLAGVMIVLVAFYINQFVLQDRKASNVLTLFSLALFGPAIGLLIARKWRKTHDQPEH